ncbi:MAG: methylmalonyl-CoA mutase, partial [Myxococcales bacterium]
MGDPKKLQGATDRLRDELASWRQEDIARAAQKAPLRRSEFHTDSGVPIPDVLTPLDGGAPSEPDVERYLRDLGLPGRFPYTRGPQPSMYRGRLWTMRQFAGFGSPEDTNKRFKYLLEHGMTGLSTAFDMPALMGYDADHAMSRGEVGKEGVAVSTLKDFEILYSGIPLDRVTTSMTINASAIFALACYVVVGEKQGVGQEKLGGTIQNDVLKEYIAQKEWVVGPRPATRVVVDMIEYTAKHMPKWHPVSISGYHIREAGATAIQELAFTLADGFGYVEECKKRGMDVDDFAPRLSFFWDVHNDFFEEIAKFRAARRIYARTMRDRFGAKKPISMMLRTHAQTAGVSLTAQQPYNNVVRTALQALAAVLGGTQSLHTNSLDETYALPTEDAVRIALRTHAQTAGVSLTAQQPYNNVVRVALQALAAVLGGTQSLHTNSLDETYALPTEEAATIALRTQQIIAHESGVDRVVDPLAGSYFVEHLTDETEKRALEILGKIERLGGIIRAIEEG